MLAGKVDVSGVEQVTLREAGQAGWDELCEDDRVPWLRRIFANNLLDEVRKFRTKASEFERELSIQALEQSVTRVNQWRAANPSSPSQRVIRQEQEPRLDLACLPNTQRVTIELHHLTGWHV